MNTPFEHVIKTPQDFGRVVRDRRRSQHLNLEDLADLVGTRRNRLQELETTPTVRLELLLRTMRELGLDVVVRNRDVHRGRGT